MLDIKHLYEGAELTSRQCRRSCKAAVLLCSAMLSMACSVSFVGMIVHSRFCSLSDMSARTKKEDKIERHAIEGSERNVRSMWLSGDSRSMPPFSRPQ